MSGDRITVPDVREFVQYLGFHPGDRDCKSVANKGYMIPCPFHDDHTPSMVVYNDGAYCYSGCGGMYYNLAYLAQHVKNISYGQALKDLGAERLEASDKMVDYRPTEIIHFCEPNPPQYVEAFQTAHAKCSTEYPEEMTKWLEKKKLTEMAKKLDWRWHDGSAYNPWGKGIVIPYHNPSTGEIEYERFRAWNEEEGKFEKVISPKGTKSCPYWSTFRGNKRQWICEGESDCASLYALGESAIGIPGSTAKTVINTILATLNDIDVVEEVIVCGDEDAAGQGMNMYVEEVAKKIAPRLHISPYKHVLTENKADMSDEYVKGVLRLPDALKTQKQGSVPSAEKVKDTFNFEKYVDRLSAYLDRCELYGVDPWVKNDKGIGVLNETAITDSLAPLIDEHYIIIEDTRGDDVLVPKLEVSGLEHFVLQINNGDHYGVYDVVYDAIAKGWTEEQKVEGAGVRMMLGMSFRDLINIDDLDFKNDGENGK